MVGFSIDLLLNAMNLSSKEITIDKGMKDLMPLSYKEAFLYYFQTDDDKVIIRPPHSLKIVEENKLQAIARGIAILRCGKEIYDLEACHNYTIKYQPPESNNKGNICLRYKGTYLKVVNVATLDAIPSLLLNQGIKETLKPHSGYIIPLEPPSLDIPFANMELELHRIILLDNNHVPDKGKQSCYFEIDMNGVKCMPGCLDISDNHIVNLNLKYRIKDLPLHISMMGFYMNEEDATTQPLGYASTIHDDYKTDPSLYGIWGDITEAQWKIYRLLIDTRVEIAYRLTQKIIDSLLNPIGVKLRTYEEVSQAVCSLIKKPIFTAKPGYLLEYSIRGLRPPKVASKFLGLFINSYTNSIYLKFDYTIEGIRDNLSEKSNIADLVYPNGLGIVVSRNLLNKVIHAYLKYSYILSGNFCSEIKDLIPSEVDKPAYFYNLSMIHAKLHMETKNIHLLTSMEAIGERDRAVGIINLINAKSDRKQYFAPKFLSSPEQAVIEVNPNISNSNKLVLTMGKTHFYDKAGQPYNVNNLSTGLHDNLTSILHTFEIGLLDLQRDFAIADKKFKLLYSVVDLSHDEIIASSLIKELRKAGIQSEQLVPRIKLTAGPVLPALKDQWGDKGIGDGQFEVPLGITVDRDGNIFVTDRDNCRIQKFDSKGHFISKWGGKGSGEGQFDLPNGIAVDRKGNVYVADSANNRIQKFDPEGYFLSQLVGKVRFFFPQGVAIDGNDNILVSDSNHLIHIFDAEANLLRQWGGPGVRGRKFYSPRGIVVDKNGDIYIADAGNNRIQKFDAKGHFITKWGSKGSDDGQFCFPQGLAVDSLGNIYVADTGNHRIQKFDSNGHFIIKWGCKGPYIGQLFAPWGIAVDGKDNIYITEAFNHRIQKFGP